MLPESEFSGREWRRLSEVEFLYDRANRTVSVWVPPNYGLLITRGGDYNPNPPEDLKFVIQEIRITGLSGEMVLNGAAVRKAFVAVPMPFYSFKPPTTLKFTYS